MPDERDRQNSTPHWRAPAMAALCLIAFVGIVQVPLFHGLHFPDPMKYADMARNFLRGDGFGANSALPRIVGQFHFTERVPAAMVRARDQRYFGYPLALAAAFELFGAKDAVVFAVSAALWVLCGVLVFLIGRRLFSEEVGVLATVLFALQAKTVGFALNGTVEPLCMALFLGGGWLLLAERRLALAAPVAGFLGAFSFYVRQPMYFIAPIAFGGFIALRRDRRLMAALLLLAGAGACFVLRPRLQTTFFPPLPPFAGRPIGAASPPPAAPKPASFLDSLFGKWGDIGILTFSARFPGHALERSIGEVGAGDRGAAADVLAKAWFNARLLAGALAWRTGAPLWMLFFLAAAVVGFREPAARRLTLTIAALLTCASAVSLLYFVMDRYFQIFIPLMALVVARGLATLLDRAALGPAKRYALAAAAIIVVSSPLPLGRLAPFPLSDAALASPDDRPKLAPIVNLLQANTRSEDIIFTDIPWMVGWYADRPCVWLPLEPADAYEIARWVKVDWLLLTLEDPQGRDTWRDWLIARTENRNMPPHELGDWTFVGAANVEGRGAYLFRRPPDEGGAKPAL